MLRKTKLLANTLKAAKNEHDLSRYLDDLDQDESWIGFRDYFFSIPKVREQKVADIIVHSGLDRTYAYQILNGRRQNPGKDKIIRLCLAAGLDLEETQRALKVSGMPILYPRDKKDATVIFAIEHGLSVISTNELLYQNGLEVLN